MTVLLNATHRLQFARLQFREPGLSDVRREVTLGRLAMAANAARTLCKRVTTCEVRIHMGNHPRVTDEGKWWNETQNCP